jgi:hypothetical protein
MAPLVLAAGCRHGRCGHGTERTPDEMAEHMKDKADYALDEVDATSEQARAARAIVDKLARDLWPLHREHAEIKAQLRKALSADRVDREELERARRKALDLIDRATARALDAVVEGGAVLSVKQRRKLASMWGRHGH